MRYGVKEVCELVCVTVKRRVLNVEIDNGMVTEISPGAISNHVDLLRIRECQVPQCASQDNGQNANFCKRGQAIATSLRLALPKTERENSINGNAWQIVEPKRWFEYSRRETWATGIFVGWFNGERLQLIV
jgi:hypothetical protein